MKNILIFLFIILLLPICIGFIIIIIPLIILLFQVIKIFIPSRKKDFYNEIDFTEYGDESFTRKNNRGSLDSDEHTLDVKCEEVDDDEEEEK